MNTIIGIDPGLVHTGIVIMKFDGDDYSVESFVIDGANHARQAKTILDAKKEQAKVRIFIEAYRSRGKTYSTDDKMRQLLAEFKQLFPSAKIIDNTGVKKVVKKELMQLLGVWVFAQITHHQDLRSAARIGLYGALKDEELNRVLFDYILKRLKGA